MGAVAWVVVAVVAVVAAGLIVRRSQHRRRTERLRRRFGPEYRRVLQERRNRRHAEAELAKRVDRHATLIIRPLSAASRERYADAWADTQRRFVDDPVGAVTQGDRLIATLMEERGYPTDPDPERRADDLSVEHGDVIANYRTATDIAERSSRNAATTEELRRAMLLYRSLFDDLLGVAHVTPVGQQAAAEEPSREPAARS
jgi:hypothetical protein